MIVTFVSQCDKKAIPKTRQILDTFANRIGDFTWQTVITEDGLAMVKKLLARKARKNHTAVSCHRFHTRKHSELVWIVGNRKKFDENGFVPVNRTKKKFATNDWENDWHYLPAIKALVAMSALLHDLGKASDLFQQKLAKNSHQADPLRHEWVSCLLLKALIHLSGNLQDDSVWLNDLAIHWQAENIIQNIQQFSDKNAINLGDLPPIAQLLAWLIVSHHRLPVLHDSKKLEDYEVTQEPCHHLTELLTQIDETWGYADNRNPNLAKCFQFSEQLLGNSQRWQQQLAKWAKRLLQEKDNLLQALANGSWRVILHHARLCLMLGDHYYSSCDSDKNWQKSTHLFANTDKHHQFKQSLDEHLFHVSQQALKVSHSLSRFCKEMNRAYDVNTLKNKSPPTFAWQDKAVTKIEKFKQQYDNYQTFGAFIVNMASTGKGKTIANAKMMQALSDDNSLRYVLALGLRTLTLQTGDVYRQALKLDKNEFAVLVGSKVVQELHEQNQNSNDQKIENKFEHMGSESLDELLDNELDFDEMAYVDFLDVLFNKNQQKQKAFLYQPILVCTIDHLISATETKRGGKYILPCLRLLSSDLVIDEVDDFSKEDFLAIARLIHLAGMLGRKVMISSATIPPDLASGFFHAYQAGFHLYCQFKQQNATKIMTMWCDEFNSQIEPLSIHDTTDSLSIYQNLHHSFVKHRIKSLLKQPVKQLAYLVNCDNIFSSKTDETSKRQAYFANIQQQIITLHEHHYQVDKKTGKKVSFGVVRMANISPCVLLSQFLMETVFTDNVAVKVMCYHSRQILLLRSEQERHLDTVLNRKADDEHTIFAHENPLIREHLTTTNKENVIFIVVATPVEEVGRDHDFDWAIIEPSSYRSIIQLAGRVQRHRYQQINQPNIAIMQYNLRALSLSEKKIAYHRPGFESNTAKFRFKDKNLLKLIPELACDMPINAIARIDKAENLKPTERFADLEHAVMEHIFHNSKFGASVFKGWLDEMWFLTALPQTFTPFRTGNRNWILYACVEKPISQYQVTLKAKDSNGDYSSQESWLNIQQYELSEIQQQRSWLKRDYIASILALSETQNNHLTTEQNAENLSKRYGELTIPENQIGKSWYYHDEFGLWVR